MLPLTWRLKSPRRRSTANLSAVFRGDVELEPRQSLTNITKRDCLQNTCTVRVFSSSALQPRRDSSTTAAWIAQGKGWLKVETGSAHWFDNILILAGLSYSY
jgi:hypothetical protein